MKFYLSIIFLTLIFFLNINAQETEIFGELSPYTNWLAKIEEENKKIICMISDTPSKKFRKPVVFFDFETKTTQNENFIIVEMRIDSKELSFMETSDGEIISRVRYFGRITSKDYKFDKVFEEIIPMVVKREQLQDSFLVNFRRALKLPKGKYITNISVNDVMTGIRVEKKIKFEIK